jgi:hypothetical protein
VKCWVVVALALAGCISQETKRDAINEINVKFKAEYEAILAKNGTRAFDASPGQAFDAAIAALVKLGFVVQQESRALGYINAEAPAPTPLTRAEWDRTSALDLPKAREILRKYIGPLAEFFSFDPEGVDIVINVTILETNTGSEVSFTMRMREVAPPKAGLPRRDYPPPSALRLGLDKLWDALDRELKTTPPKR